MQCHHRLPELSCGHIAITDKADMHALGCLLVEMCTGEPSDTGALTLKVFHPQAEATPSPLVHIMQRCLCVAPERRPTAAEVQQVRPIIPEACHVAIRCNVAWIKSHATATLHIPLTTCYMCLAVTVQCFAELHASAWSCFLP